MYLKFEMVVNMQGQEGERDPNPGPRTFRHANAPPLPGVDRNWEGTLDVPEEILTWKGSIFSVFSNAVADWDGSGYGPLLQTPSVRHSHPLHPPLKTCNLWRQARH